jgi:hypothetical protein
MRFKWKDIVMKTTLVNVPKITPRIRLGLYIVKLGVKISGLGFQYDGVEPPEKPEVQ